MHITSVREKGRPPVGGGGAVPEGGREQRDPRQSVGGSPLRTAIAFSPRAMAQRTLLSKSRLTKAAAFLGVAWGFIIHMS